MRTCSTLAALAVGLWSLAASAQFASLETVTIAVTVTDKAGNSVAAPLTADNFRVKEDGREQSIVSVTAGPAPISVAVVLGTEDEMLGIQQRLGVRAVERLAARLTPDDQISLVMYRQQIEVAVPWTAGNRFPKIDWTTWQTTPFNELLNSVRSALFLMDGAKHARRAVLAVAGHDEAASAWGLDKYVVSQAQSETAIYGLRTDDYTRRPASDTTGGAFMVSSGRMVSLEDVLRDGGGRMFPTRTTAEAESSVDKFIDELRKQYVIRYLPSKPFDGKYRKLKVELKNTKDLKIRHRLGYLAKAPRT